MNLNQIREKTKWLGLMCGAIFLVISTYMRWKFVAELEMRLGCYCL
jgi:hypothetical protein